MLVFAKVLAEHEELLAADKIVLARGRVDHKDADKTCLVVQSVEAFEPSEEEVRKAQVQAEEQRAAVTEPVRLRLDAARLPAGATEELKGVFERFPGPVEVVLEMETSTGLRRLKLGAAYRVKPSPMLHAELEHLLAPAVATTVPAPAGATAAAAAS